MCGGRHAEAQLSVALRSESASAVEAMEQLRQLDDSYRSRHILLLEKSTKQIADLTLNNLQLEKQWQQQCDALQQAVSALEEEKSMREMEGMQEAMLQEVAETQGKCILLQKAVSLLEADNDELKPELEEEASRHK